MKKLYLLIGLCISLLLVACNSEESKPSEDQTTEEQSEAQTVTDSLEHEVTIPANPQKVIAPYLEDPLLALGITPVAQWSVNDGASIQNYLQEQLKDIPTIPHDLPFEAVTSHSPDLLIISSPDLVAGDKYDQYSKIAPTYVFGEDAADWKSKLIKVAEIFNKTEEVDQVIADYESFVADANKEIADAGKNGSAAAIWIVNNSIFMVSKQASSGVVLYDGLGLQTPALVQEISKSATSDWSQVSEESFAQLDADYLFVINSDAAGGTELLQSSALSQIPAIKNKKVFEVDPNSSWLYSGVIANKKIVEDTLGFLIP